jgi:hypothetical protein
LLAFDDIRDAAEVRLNGRPLGILFTPRLEVEGAAALRKGANDLEIVVVNRPLRRLRPEMTAAGPGFLGRTIVQEATGAVRRSRRARK